METPYRSRLGYSLERLHILSRTPRPQAASERERHRKHSARIARPPAMDDDRKNGMGIVIEYANRTVSQPDETIPIVFGKINGGQGGFNRWTINGASFDVAADFAGPIAVCACRRWRPFMEVDRR